MEMYKYNFVPKFEQLQVIYYLSCGKDVFVVALHALSIMFAMLCDHHLTTIAGHLLFLFHH
jgi:GTP cyclohydrolase I